MKARSGIVLIVDNDPGACATLEGFLLPEGYELAFAENGPQALARAKELAPDLVLLDVMMPGMTGFEVCQRLRADPLLAEVPVIMVTALDDRESRLQALEVGADDFVSKPVDRAELRARVRAVMRLNRYRQLLLERAKFEWVVDQANEGYLVADERDRVTYINPQARLYLGLDESGAPLATFRQLAERGYRCEPQEAWAAWPTRDASLPPVALYLVRPETPAANAVWLSVSVLDLPAGERIIRLQDVSERRTLESKLDQFHLMVCHKLRTPLTYALGSLELLEQGVAGSSEEEVAEFTAVALRGIRRLHDEIEDILGYVTAPGLSRSGPGYKLAQLPDLMAGLGYSLELKTLTVSGCEQVGEREVQLSQRSIELVLWEILQNAKKFHPQQNPTVDVVVSMPNDRQVKLQVRDDGQTLSPAQLAQVWTPYYQAEKSFTGEVAGMGLGLSMVATLVWGMGGTSRIYNRDDGPGVVVELVLPLHAGAQE